MAVLIPAFVTWSLPAAKEKGRLESRRPTILPLAAESVVEMTMPDYAYTTLRRLLLRVFSMALLFRPIRQNGRGRFLNTDLRARY